MLVLCQNHRLVGIKFNHTHKHTFSFLLLPSHSLSTPTVTGKQPDKQTDNQPDNQQTDKSSDEREL